MFHKQIQNVKSKDTRIENSINGKLFSLVP